MRTIFTDFAGLPDTRVSRAVPMTEDSVRYTLFAAMLRNNFEPHAVILEFPRPVIARAAIDTSILGFHGKDVTIEFKYDRDPPGGKNQPEAAKAGAVFADLHRLQLIDGAIRILSVSRRWRWTSISATRAMVTKSHMS